MKRGRKSLVLGFVGLSLAGLCAVGAGRAVNAQAEGRRAALFLGELYVEGEGLLPADARHQAREMFDQLGAMIGERAMERADTNGDGALDEAERAAAKTKLREAAGRLKAAALVRFDTDLDGTIAPAEREAILDGVRGRVAAMRTAADTDGDGRLSDDEIKAAASAGLGDGERLKRLAAAGIAPLLTETDRAKARVLAGEIFITVRRGIMQNFDADKDGALSDTERTALRQRAMERGEEIKAAALAAGDADGDGTLARQERRALGVRLVTRWLGINP